MFQIDWRPVTWGFGVQFILGMIVLRWPWGHRKFQQLSNIIVTFLDYTNNGTTFVYGFLAQPPNICGTSPVFFFTVSYSPSRNLKFLPVTTSCHLLRLRCLPPISFRHNAGCSQAIGLVSSPLTL